MSECQKIHVAIDHETNLSRTCRNVWEMSSDAAKKALESNRIHVCFIKVIECLQYMYLAWQGHSMQGNTDNESNFIQLLKLRGKDQPLLLKWLERKEDRYTSHDIQNEIIAAIMANHIIRDLVSEMKGGFFSIICDDYTDISNKEQLTICIRWVDKELEAHEDFLRFHNVPGIGAETIVSAIKAVFLKLQLSLVNCRGQCYDGASNMMGHKTGVGKRIQDLQPKAFPTHCHGHSLSSSVKDTTKNL